ncbi:MAG: hypothetical protein V3S11_06860 [Elusimicrobiota bacterium]
MLVKTLGAIFAFLTIAFTYLACKSGDHFFFALAALPALFTGAIIWPYLLKAFPALKRLFPPEEPRAVSFVPHVWLMRTLIIAVVGICAAILIPLLSR